jgi:hypothetical protein
LLFLQACDLVAGLLQSQVIGIPSCVVCYRSAAADDAFGTNDACESSSCAIGDR